MTDRLDRLDRLVRQSRRNRQTGAIVEIEDTDHPQSILDPAGGRWATVCVDHGTLVNHDTLRLARRFAPVPAEWCDGCRKALDTGASR